MGTEYPRTFLTSAVTLWASAVASTLSDALAAMTCQLSAPDGRVDPTRAAFASTVNHLSARP